MLRPLLIALSLALLASCAPEVEDCPAGQAVICACLDGDTGTATCTAEGGLTACQCASCMPFCGTDETSWTCNLALNCKTHCADAACEAACLAHAPIGVRAKLDALWNCVSGCPQTANPCEWMTGCFYGGCYAEFAACRTDGIAPAPGGEIDSCLGLLNCINACEDEDCRLGCYAGATDDGLSAFYDLWSCGMDGCCRPDAVVAEDLDYACFSAQLQTEACLLLCQ